MTTVALNPALPGGGRILLLVALLPLAVVALAETVERLQTSPDYDHITREEVFEEHREWRLDPPPENAWREGETAPQDNARIKFGFDRDYEETIRRNDQQFGTGRHEFGDDRPTTILRFNF